MQARVSQEFIDAAVATDRAVSLSKFVRQVVTAELLAGRYLGPGKKKEPGTRPRKGQ
jgi:hypothetical protein